MTDIIKMRYYRAQYIFESKMYEEFLFAKDDSAAQTVVNAILPNEAKLVSIEEWSFDDDDEEP